MRITLNELRSLIREHLINEGAVTPIQAAGDGIALFSSENELFATYVLYRATGHVNSVVESTLSQKTDSVETTVRWSLVGAIKVAKGQGGEPSYVEEVASKVKGYGPLLYDIALKYHSPLLDRRGDVENANVSPDAEKVWDFYVNKRKKDTSYSKKTRQLSLKSKLTVDVRPLVIAHDNLPNKIYTNPRSFQANLPPMSTFVKQLEEALHATSKDLLRTLHM